MYGFELPKRLPRDNKDRVARDLEELAYKHPDYNFVVMFYRGDYKKTEERGYRWNRFYISPDDEADIQKCSEFEIISDIMQSAEQMAKVSESVLSVEKERDETYTSFIREKQANISLLVGELIRRREEEGAAKWNR